MNAKNQSQTHNRSCVCCFLLGFGLFASGTTFFIIKEVQKDSSPQSQADYNVDINAETCDLYEYPLSFNTNYCPMKKNDCVLQYKGIQYATALRFQKPVLKNLTLDTCGVKYGSQNQCYQEGDTSIQEKQCLYLDVFTKSSKTNMPVMVFSHGGGHKSGFNGRLFGDNVLTTTEDVVYVNFQYRLGIFGIAGTEELVQSHDHVTSPLIYDHESALQWIQQYIHLFGGDPTKVTFAGFSAGAINTALVLSSPIICPLFQRAIAYGFWNTRPRVLKSITRQEQEKLFKKALNISNVTHYLLNAAAHELWPLTNAIADSTGDTRPAPDGYLVKHSHLTYSNPCNLPVIIDGSISELSLWETLFGQPQYTDIVADGIRSQWNATYGESTIKHVFSEYVPRTEETPHDANVRLANDIASLSNIYGAQGIQISTNTSPVYSVMHSWIGPRGSHGHGAGVALLNKQALMNIDNISSLSHMSHLYRKKIYEFMNTGKVSDWSQIGNNTNIHIIEVTNSNIKNTNLQTLSPSMYDVFIKIKDAFYART